MGDKHKNKKEKQLAHLQKFCAWICDSVSFAGPGLFFYPFYLAEPSAICEKAKEGLPGRNCQSKAKTTAALLIRY